MSPERLYDGRPYYSPDELEEDRDGPARTPRCPICSEPLAQRSHGPCRRQAEAEG